MPASRKETLSAGGVVRGRRRWVFASGLFLLAGVVLSGVVGGYYWLRVEIPEPPVVELSKLEPFAVKAIQEARAAVIQSPRSPAAWGRLGVVFAAFKFPPQARACFACAERLDPRDPRWPYLQVQQHDALNDPQAIPKLQRAMELDPNPPDGVRLDLAEILMAQGRLDEAEPHFRAALRHDSANPRTHLGLARLAFARGRFAESLASLQRATASPFTQKAACLLLAQVHQAVGDAAAAAQDAQRWSQLPEDQPFPPPYFARETAQLLEDKTALSHAEQMAGQGQVTGAMAILQRLVSKYPDWGQAWRGIGELLLMGGNYPAAEQALRKAVRLAPDSAKPHFYLGVALSEQGRQREAAASFRQATELKSDYAEAYYGLSRCLQALGDRNGAEQALRAAIRYLPSYAQARATLGELLAQSGRPAEGLEQLRCAAQLRPDDKQIHKLIQQLEAQCPVGPMP